ncbi:response regulator [Cohnella zeiphila]|uniref:Response regulator transcription factor n=1 Tax=Cohnella zeiphila TaxID=2761120 RepID=A0A7X0SHD9_9BACL|nr:response regulator transcription factor [Cohnella zeiphila]
MNKVVLVEDEIFARQGLRNLIDWESCGFRVCGEADNGEEALSAIAEWEPDLIITDIRMPVLDGLELIRTVRASGNRDVKFIIVSGYGDFKYAQQAIKFGVKDFILKPIDEDELTEALKQLASQIEKDKLLKDASAGYERKALERLLQDQTGEEELAALAELLGLERGGRYGYVIVEANGMTPQAGRTPSDDRPEPRDWRGEIARTAERLETAAHPVHLHEVRPGVWGFPALLGPSDSPDALEEAAERLASRLRRQWDLPVMVYIGEIVSGLGALRDAYLSACETIQYKFAFADRSVLRRDRLPERELRYAEFEPAEYAARLEQLEEGDPDSRSAAVDWIFEQIRTKRYAPEAVQNAIARFVFGVIGAVRSLQGDETELRSLESVLQWREYPVTLSGLKERFRAFVEESAELAARLRKNNAKGEIVKIKQYIENHYREDINLKSIAAKFYMNPVYLGQLFRKTYGVYFNDFLLQLRIQNAKRLLRQTELRVYEIARSVGFDNADYFVCKFEKVEGKTPTAYRNELLAKT